MKISLFVLIDADGRILYSGSYNDCYIYKYNGMIDNLQIIELKGETKDVNDSKQSYFHGGRY